MTTTPSPLIRATDADLPEISLLVNAAYRGPEAAKGWTSEADMIGGERTNVEQLRAEIARPDAHLLILRDDDADRTLLGCVMVEKMKDAVWYLGMLTVRPHLQSRGTGRVLLTGGEDYARERGAAEMHMTVVSIRATLIAWYERRGYRDTGDRLPYPYGDPPRPDLRFAVLTKTL
jgi:ribosomal protein S18 acetylase RimI-like enzyme